MDQRTKEVHIICLFYFHVAFRLAKHSRFADYFLYPFVDCFTSLLSSIYKEIFWKILEIRKNIQINRPPGIQLYTTHDQAVIFHIPFGYCRIDKTKNPEQISRNQSWNFEFYTLYRDEICQLWIFLKIVCRPRF